ncbi:hypothetical protein JOL79_11920 [Microbispora sp. RL4-1S]|uniref:Uncharacterized protein n=1 Tax=Microbispora oryzae TaxID=2806554 RepID=A0A940WFG4_9ACTN|nr:hypothetical protein [Microbispora oryzae]MBP2704521.1 hypothetical protein [Microbispora oryzae]
MVQVDVFWSYAIGAGLAAASSWQACAGPRPAPRWSDPHLTGAVLFSSLLFAPSGIWLLWRYPDWETMQVARDHTALAPWLVALFAAADVGLAVIGYRVARRLGGYLMFLQPLLGYGAMFFVLVHGWDGRGYQRFLSPDRAAFGNWPEHPSPAQALGLAARWFTSPVAYTLAGMSVMLVVLAMMMSAWLGEGHRLARAGGQVSAVPGPAGRTLLMLAGLPVVLALAVAAGLLIDVFGWWTGVPAALALAWFVAVRPGAGLLHLIHRRLVLPGSSVGRRRRRPARAVR